MDKYDVLVLSELHELFQSHSFVKESPFLIKMINSGPWVNLSPSYKVDKYKAVMRGLRHSHLVEVKDGFIHDIHAIPDPEIFLVHQYIEGIERNVYGYNEGDVLMRFLTSKLFLAQKLDISKMMKWQMMNDYVIFGHQTGGTINYNHQKIDELVSRIDAEGKTRRFFKKMLG